jgi:3-methylfumaryl-CoA hydratase
MTKVTADALASWRNWIGRRESTSQLLDPVTLRRFAAAIGVNLDVEQRWPELGHWAYFHPVVPSDDLGHDGHPRRGAFYPPITLPRRMFAAAEIEFFRPLALHSAATLTTAIHDVRHRHGGHGELVIVDVERLIEQHGTRCLREIQSIVFTELGGRVAPIPVSAKVDQDSDIEWCPGPVDLFRFSAATANSHRIHYDAPYASAEEGYPGLVVQGPLTAAKLCRYARRPTDRPVSAFVFRARAPLFVSQPVRLRHGDLPGQVTAIRCDGSIAMEARATFAA